MSSPVSEDLRRLVVTRANHLCEYCLVHEEDRFYGCQIDHIISEKHGGPTEPENLAYACPPCNRHKGSDIASIHWPTGRLLRLFNPRTDRWHEHFSLQGAFIKPLTEIGEVTAQILMLNSSDRLLEREELNAVGRYPSSAALERMAAA